MLWFYNQTKKGATYWEKLKSLKLHVDKSDVQAVTPDGSLYPSLADMPSTALIYLPDTWRLLIWGMDVGSMEEQTAYIVQVIMLCMRTWALLPPL